MAGHSVRDLYRSLVKDEWRVKNAFSEDLAKVNQVLFDAFADEKDRQEAVSLWLQDRQPCLFGRVAAAQDRIQYCILTDQDLQRPDEDIAQRIQEAVLAWKRRSLRPHPSISRPAHGFMLLVASPRVALAAPNEQLRQLALALLGLWGARSSEEDHGDVFWETLYLHHPEKNVTFRFSIMIDFFAAQCDQRWSHDHRVPGGLAFTANSAGHMGRYREWYEKKAGQDSWLLATAMRTIHMAAPTPYGPATWLREVPEDGHPFLPGTACPFKDPESVHESIRKKDWTRYGGRFHTDQSVRDEFFSASPEPPQSAVVEGEWLLDFTYLYASSDVDHQRLVQGEPVSASDVAAAIGAPGDWTRIPTTRKKRSVDAVTIMANRAVSKAAGEIVLLRDLLESGGTPAEDAASAASIDLDRVRQMMDEVSSTLLTVQGKRADVARRLADLSTWKLPDTTLRLF